MPDTALLLAFAALTALTSVVPGPNMLFLAAQAAWRGPRGGAVALAGLQVGNAGWFVLAGLGLGSALAAAPMLFEALMLAGAGYLAWLGVQAWRQAARPLAANGPAAPVGVPRGPARPFRDGIVVALANPKSLVYVAALLPPFVDPRQPVALQLALLAGIAIALDVAVGLAYIFAGSRFSAAMARPALSRAIGLAFIALAIAVLASAIR